MALPEPENAEIDHPKLDSGVHVRDMERAPAGGRQIVGVGLLVLAILIVFFYGLESQHPEIADVAGIPPGHSDVASPAGADQQRGAPQTPAQAANTNAPAPDVKQAPPQMTTGSAPRR